MRMFGKSALSALVLLAPTVVLAAGTTPDDPIDLTIDGAPQAVSLNPSTPEAWLEIDGDPSGISHLALETTGAHDTRLFLYRDLADALADEPVADDDDSGDGTNARIERFLGYPLPWLLKVTLYYPSDSATVSVQCTSAINPPEVCTGAGPCTFSVSASGQEGGGGVLAYMRGVRNFVLRSSPRGQELIDLYYQLSAQLLYDAMTDSLFRERLFHLGSSFLPEIREALAVGLGDPSQAVLSDEVVARARELEQLLSDRLSPELAGRLEEWTRLLETQVGRSFKQAMEDLGLSPTIDSRFTLPADKLHPVKRGELAVKLSQAPRIAPSLIGGRLMTGLPRLDDVLRHFYVDSAEPVFRRLAAGGEIGLDRVLRIRVSAEETEALRSALGTTGEVEYAEPISVAYLASDDLYYDYQYGPAAVGAPAVWPTASLGVPLVGVIDSGIDWRQADLIDRTRTDLGWNFVDESSDAMDDHGHGTHVAGTIAATVDNLYSVAGICPDAEVVPYRVCGADGNCTWDDVAEAIAESADAGIPIVNMSLGGPFEQLVEDALQHAHGAGVLLIAAAGNDGQEGSSFPASSEYTLSVGATDDQNLLASFSNWGDLDLTAPGVDIVNLSLEGQSCYNSGTSMAAPHVAGVAALLASRRPSLDREELAARLLLGGTDLGDPGYDPYYGHGLVNANESLRLILAVHWPLTGFPAERPPNSLFGADWDGSGGGQVKIHSGTDLPAVAGEAVYAAHAGTVAAVPDGGTTWAKAVTLESAEGYTTVYWHVDPLVGNGATVELGDKIATVADLGGDTHLHFGFRRAPYSNTSNRGALPQQECAGDPPFPELFEDPQTLTFGHLLVADRQVAADQVLDACNTLQAQNVRVQGAAHLTLRAGRMVALRDEFSTADGASLIVATDDSILCP